MLDSISREKPYMVEKFTSVCLARAALSLISSSCFLSGVANFSVFACSPLLPTAGLKSIEQTYSCICY